MKFGIKKVILSESYSISGKLLSREVVYVAYRRLFFGLIRLYLAVCPKYVANHGKSKTYYIRYVVKFRDATWFFFLEDVEAFVRDLKFSPDSFIREKRKKLI